jgi:hypothetical protein
MKSRSLLTLVFAILAGASFGCAGSAVSSVVDDTTGDSGSTPTTNTDAGSTTVTTADAGTPVTPTVDAGAPACTTKTYANFGQAFFASKCNDCHSFQSPRMTTQSAIRSNLAAITSAISVGRMPEGIPLRAQEKTDVLEWVNCGAN